MPSNFAKGIGALDTLSARDSSFGDIKGIEDVYRRFGLGKDSVSNIYDPLRNVLGKDRGRALQSAGFRSGRNATPGMSFSRIESGFGDQLSRLLSGQGQAELGQQNTAAEFLRSIFGQQDQYALNKSNQLSSGYLNYDQLDFQKEQSKASWLDILSSILGPAAKVGAAALTPVSLFGSGGKGTFNNYGTSYEEGERP